MSSVNVAVKHPPVVTHEGAPAVRITPLAELRRTVLTCMLWEKNFYESGDLVASRIADLVRVCDPPDVARLAVEAREKMHLRHVPLLVIRELARYANGRKGMGSLVRHAVRKVIQRPDEMTELLAIYWRDGRCKLADSIKRGLADAFVKFKPETLAKYDRKGKVRLRDVLFLCHAKPLTKEQAEAWKQLISGTLTAPDTWEVALSGGKGKKETWERLLREGALGGLATLRNLRNMKESEVDESLIRERLRGDFDRVLPFRFIAAARHAPNLEDELGDAMLRGLHGHERLTGKTILLVDVSGSMNDNLSAKSDLTRMDAACGLAMLLREVCESVAVYTFSNELVEVPPRHAFALRDAIVNSQPHVGTYLGKAIAGLEGKAGDRLIVITDEQSHDRVQYPSRRGYMLNVAPNKNGVGYHGSWTHIDGFSEAVVDFIQMSEADDSVSAAR